jgi:membrane protease YdiL (CAAX protease family)
MNSFIASLILIFVAIAFVATIIAGLLKLVFFLKRKDTYKQILKFGLLGEVAGLIVMFAIWPLYRKEMNNWEEPESIIAIPFFLMLLGQIIGTIVVFRNKLKT